MEKPMSGESVVRFLLSHVELSLTAGHVWKKKKAYRYILFLHSRLHHADDMIDLQTVN